MAARTATKINSLISILRQLDGGKKLTASFLAGYLGVSERTIYRYMMSIQDAGYPVRFDRAKMSYCFSNGFQLGHDGSCGLSGLNGSRSAASPVGLISYDSTGRCVEANDAAAAILGMPRQGLLGQNYNQLPAWHQSGMLLMAREVMAGGADASGDFCITDRAGRTVWLDCTMSGYSKDDRSFLMLMIRDISNRKQTENALKENEDIFRLFIANNPAYTYIKDHNLRVIQVSRNFEQLVGRSAGQVIGKSAAELFPSRFAEAIEADDRSVLASGKMLEREEEFNGRLFSTVKFPFFRNGVPYLAGYTTDITDRKAVEEALRESEEKYRILFRDSPDAYLIIVDGLFVECNRAAEAMLHGDRTEIIGKPPELLSPEYQPDGNRSSEAAVERINEALRSGSTNFEWLHRRLDGTDFWVEVSLASIRFSDGPALFTIWRDISARKQIEQALEESRRKLEEMSISDSLTGIANRRYFDEVLLAEYGRHVRSGGELSLILMDIDHFKLFNDTYGHIKGDECLRLVGRVLAECTTRTVDLAARYGGEEFACILPETDRSGAIIIAEKIRRGIQALAIPHKASNVADHVTASLGVVVSVCTLEGSALDILAQADELLYRAKSSGRNRVEIDASAVTTVSMEEVSGNFLQFVWKDFFSCGDPLIDSQHQALLQASNHLFTAIFTGRPHAYIAEVIDSLLADVSRHFHDEQVILEKAGYPDIRRHMDEHAGLLAKGLELQKRFTASALDVGEVFQFLAYDVVMIHMLGADREYFPYVSGETAL